MQTDQVLYNLTRRGIEYDLLPWCRDTEHPDHGLLADRAGPAAQPSRRSRAWRRGTTATPAQVALAWVLRHDGVIAIPKAGTREHVQQNHAALDLRLTEDDFTLLDGAFPPPLSKKPLEML